MMKSFFSVINYQPFTMKLFIANTREIKKIKNFKSKVFITQKIFSSLISNFFAKIRKTKKLKIMEYL